MRVASFWSGSTDTVYAEEEVLLTAGDCWTLVHSGKCGGYVMRQEGNVWKYGSPPRVESSYLRTVSGETLNCFYEKFNV